MSDYRAAIVNTLTVDGARQSTKELFRAVDQYSGDIPSRFRTTLKHMVKDGTLTVTKGYGWHKVEPRDNLFGGAAMGKHKENKYELTEQPIEVCSVGLTVSNWSECNCSNCK